jgi:hypothetical protein
VVEYIIAEEFDTRINLNYVIWLFSELDHGSY